MLCCPLVAPLGLAFFALWALIKRGIPLLLRLLWRGLVGLCKLLLYTAVQLRKLLLYTAVKLCELLLGLLKLIGKLVGAAAGLKWPPPCLTTPPHLPPWTV